MYAYALQFQTILFLQNNNIKTHSRWQDKTRNERTEIDKFPNVLDCSFVHAYWMSMKTRCYFVFVHPQCNQRLSSLHAANPNNNNTITIVLLIYFNSISVLFLCVAFSQSFSPSCSFPPLVNECMRTISMRLFKFINLKQVGILIHLENIRIDIIRDNI